MIFNSYSVPGSQKALPIHPWTKWTSPLPCSDHWMAITKYKRVHLAHIADGISSGYFIIIAVVVKMFTRVVIYKSGSEKFLPTPQFKGRVIEKLKSRTENIFLICKALDFLEISLSWMFCKDFTLLDQMLLNLNVILCLSYSQRMCEGKKSILDKL